MFQSAQEAIDFIQETDVKFVDIRFTDLPGVQHHFNIPAATVDLEFFEIGQMFLCDDTRPVPTKVQAT